jgi:predicted permease
MVARLVAYLRGLVGRRRVDAECLDELRFHLANEIEAHRARGLSPIEARRRALCDLGGVTQTREAVRDVRATWLDIVWLDLRHATRGLSRDRGTAIVAVMALALGISVSNTFFTLVNAICLRGLPIERPERVVFIGSRDAEGRPGGLSYLDVADVGRAARSFVALAAYGSASLTVSDRWAPADRVSATFVSAGAFQLLGVRPVVGREFQPEDDRAGAAPTAILGGALWKSRYGSDPSIVGRTIKVNGQSSTVVGVMPDEFRFPANAAIWQPLGSMPGLSTGTRASRSLSLIGRLSEPVAVASAQAELEVISARLAADHPDTNRDIRLYGTPINEQFNGRITETAWLAFLTAGLLVLLVACANVANLLLMRSAARSRELAIRASIGASRWRIVHQLLVESALLAALGGMLGLALSALAVRLLAESVPAFAPLPYWIEFAFDRRVFAVLAAVCVTSVFVFGLVPAWQASRTKPNDILKQGGTVIGSRGRRWTSAFLAIEFALTVVLLSNVAYALREELRASPPDEVELDMSPLLTGSFAFPAGAYQAAAGRTSFVARLGERLRARGLATLAIASSLAPAGSGTRRVVLAGPPAEPPDDSQTTQTLFVSEHYFDVLGVQMRHGRSFDERDGTSGQSSAIVNQRFAMTFFQDRDPIGQQIKLVTSGQDAATLPWITIVGVSPTIGGEGGLGADELVYLPYRSAPPASGVLIVRAVRAEFAAVAAVVREQARQLDPDLPVYRMMPMDEAVRQSGWNGRVAVSIIYTISGIAFLLALVGLYAVASHSVWQRRREIGIRMALGARPGRVALLVLRRAQAQLAVGLVLGLGLTFVFQHFFMPAEGDSRLTEPLVLVPLYAAVMLIGAAACLSPAIRAARLDPLIELRAE